MNDDIRIALHNHVQLFAQNIVQVINDVTGTQLKKSGKLIDEPLSRFDGTIVYANLTGMIQGYYMIVLSEEIAHAIAKPLFKDEEHSLEEYSAIMAEILNISIGKSIVDLERFFGSLTFLSPIVSFGRVIFPQITSCGEELYLSKGQVITAIFSLNMANTKVGKLLQETIALLSEKTQQANTDGLTGLFNRRFLNDYLKQTITQARTSRIRYSLIIIDIDKFKKFNDTYGHQFGDQVIQSVANGIQKNLRPCDIAARYGGDEFVLLLPDLSPDQAYGVAANICNNVRENPIEINYEQSPLKINITLSLGVAILRDGDTEETFLARADAALYAAKAAGRDTIALR